MTVLDTKIMDDIALLQPFGEVKRACWSRSPFTKGMTYCGREKWVQVVVLEEGEDSGNKY